MAGRRRKADEALVLALACGAAPEGAALKAQVSKRTVYRRLADPRFSAQVKQVRADLVQRTAGLLTAAGMASIRTLTNLQDTAQSEAVRLGAARAVLELRTKLRAATDVEERLAALEQEARQRSGSANKDRGDAQAAGLEDDFDEPDEQPTKPTPAQPPAATDEEWEGGWEEP